MKLSFKTLVATAVVALSVGSLAHAQDSAPAESSSPRQRGGLFIEPGVTYEMGDVKAKTASIISGVTSDSTGEANGLGVVARLGIHVNDIIFVAADGRYSKLRHNLSLYDGKTDADAWQLAPVVGVQTPYAGIRVWAGYVAAAGLDPKGADGWDIKYEKGQGWLAGAGLRLGIVSLNLEYKNVQFDRMVAQNNPGPITIGSTDIEGEDRAWIASLTFPLAL